MLESEGDFNVAQIDSFRRGEESFSKISLPPLFRYIEPMTFTQFQNRIDSIGCWWGTYSSFGRAAQKIDIGEYPGDSDAIAKILATDNSNPHSKEEWDRKIRKTNRRSGANTSKYTGIQAGDDLYFLPFLFYRNLPVFIYGPVDKNKFETVKYSQLYDSDGLFKFRENYQKRNIPIFPEIALGGDKSLWTIEAYKAKIGKSNVPRHFFRMDQMANNTDVEIFLQDNIRRLKPGIVTDSNAPKRPKRPTTPPATPSGEIVMEKPPRPEFIEPSGYSFKLEYDEDTGVYYPDELMDNVSVAALIRWANAEETKEELDAILGADSYVVNDDGTIQTIDPE